MLACNTGYLSRALLNRAQFLSNYLHAFLSDRQNFSSLAVTCRHLPSLAVTCCHLPRDDAPVAPRVSAAVFDNFEIRALGGLLTDDNAGAQIINKTNGRCWRCPVLFVKCAALCARVTRLFVKTSS
eukprot:4133000-Pleurochrysis_carterae.AAC.1